MSEIDTYRTIESNVQGLYKEKGSKFLSFAYNVNDIEEIKSYIAVIKKEFFDARHHCYAYILGHKKDIFRMNDDGEPSATAGKPIYGQLLSNDLSNILVVVVRYFGGTKLGTSGLIQAYKAATEDAISNANIIEKIVKKSCIVSFKYEQMNSIMKIVKDEELETYDHLFEVECTMGISIRLKDFERIFDRLREVSDCVSVVE